MRCFTFLAPSTLTFGPLSSTISLTSFLCPSFPHSPLGFFLATLYTYIIHHDERQISLLPHHPNPLNLSITPNQLFDAKTDDLVATARKPADQAYSTAKSYQDLVSTRLHDTILTSQQTLSSLNEKLASAAAVARDHVPKNTKDAQDLAREVLEQLEKAKEVIAKQSGDLVGFGFLKHHAVLKDCRI